ncbi:Nodulation protein D 2 [Variovorax boronicumulans]|nr:Nodulation protein D 2 [Variovorax boronicumulans]
MRGMHAENLDLNLLAVFDAMFREASVTKAAQGLGLTQSAMSHALNRLRAFFDDPLFVKVGSRMEPTRKAEGMRAAVVEVMTTVRQQILAGARFEPTLARRTFTLCMTDMGELVFLPPLLERFKKEAPGCSLRTLQVPLEQVEGLLASGEADLAVGSIRAAPEGLFHQRLFLHSFVTIASARNKDIGATLTRERFEAMRHIVVSLTGHSAESYDKVLEDQGIRRTVAVMTPHFLMVPLLMDRHADLLATVPRELAEVFARMGTVRMFEPPVPVPQFQLNQHWHPRFHHDPAVVWLRDVMKHTFEHYPRITTQASPPARKGARARSR